ncbi:MAG: hypothetical protein CMO80_18825 [Verrucomicrobiales bacterium]|nr:hypothetical protein [Verrucomicrobiales bacterium]|tara:strand:+ start:3695 stop:4108 length:414 start_codon:yes stop_codon:yes gene_type:complete
MKKVILTLVCAVTLSTLGTGCINTVDGRKRAAVPFRKDKVFSRYQVPVQDAVNAAKYVLASEQGGLGVLQAENRINGSLIAKVNKRTVWVRVRELEPTVSEVVTQARTEAGWGDVALASEIDKQIALRLQVVISGGR